MPDGQGQVVALRPRLGRAHRGAARAVLGAVRQRLRRRDPGRSPRTGAASRLGVDARRRVGSYGSAARRWASSGAGRRLQLRGQRAATSRPTATATTAQRRATRRTRSSGSRSAAGTRHAGGQRPRSAGHAGSARPDARRSSRPTRARPRRRRSQFNTRKTHRPEAGRRTSRRTASADTSRSRRGLRRRAQGRSNSWPSPARARAPTPPAAWSTSTATTAAARCAWQRRSARAAVASPSVGVEYDAHGRAAAGLHQQQRRAGALERDEDDELPARRPVRAGGMAASRERWSALRACAPAACASIGRPLHRPRQSGRQRREELRRDHAGGGLLFKLRRRPPLRARSAAASRRRRSPSSHTEPPAPGSTSRCRRQRAATSRPA